MSETRGWVVACRVGHWASGLYDPIVNPTPEQNRQMMQDIINDWKKRHPIKAFFNYVKGIK